MKFKHKPHDDYICGVLKISDDVGTCGKLALQSCQDFRKAYTGVRVIYEDYVAGRIGRAIIQESIDVLHHVLILERQSNSTKEARAGG